MKNFVSQSPSRLRFSNWKCSTKTVSRRMTRWEMLISAFSLQPLVAAARLRNILEVASEGTTLRKVIPEKDNWLAVDSSSNWVHGEVVQDVWLRLCEVESGDIELKIKLTGSLQVECFSVTSMHVSFELDTSCCKKDVKLSVLA